MSKSKSDANRPDALFLEYKDLQSFSPRFLQSRLAAFSSRTSATSTPNNVEEAAWSLDCAALRIEARGLATLTEQMTMSEHGAFDFTRIMNAYFSILADVASAHGGDILTFESGNVATIAFYMPDNEIDRAAASVSETKRGRNKVQSIYQHMNSMRGLGGAVVAAAKCSEDIHDKLAHFFTEIAPHLCRDQYNRVNEIAIRVSMGCGPIVAFIVGGFNGMWSHVVAGTALDQIAVAKSLAQPGETICSPQAWDHLNCVATGNVIQQGFVSISQLNEAIMQIKKTSSSSSSLSSSSFSAAAAAAATKASLSPQCCRPTPAKILKCFVPENAGQSVDAGRIADLSELRQAVIVSIKVHDIDLVQSACTEAAGPGAGTRLLRESQRTVYQSGGTIHSFSVEKKAVVIVAVFGLPPGTHLDDETRAIWTAFSLMQRLKCFGFTCSIGIATGKVISGVIGSTLRRAHTIVGKSVATSEHLMSTASSGQVLVDFETCLHAQLQTDFVSFEMCIASPTEAFQAMLQDHHLLSLSSRGSRAGSGRCGSHNTTSEGLFVGRLHEQRILHGMLEICIAQRQGGLIIIEGERGTGKTALADAFFGPTAAMFHFTLYKGGPTRDFCRRLVGDKANDTCSAFRPILLKIFNDLITAKPHGDGEIATGVNDASADRRLRAAQDRMPFAVRKFAALLNTILPELALSDTAASLDLKLCMRQESAASDQTYQDSQQWKDRLIDVVVGVLQVATLSTPAILIMDDAQDMDQCSWEVIRVLISTNWTKAMNYENSICPIVFVLLQRTTMSRSVASGATLSEWREQGDVCMSLQTFASEIQCLLTLGPMVEKDCIALANEVLHRLRGAPGRRTASRRHLSVDNNCGHDRALLDLAIARAEGNALFMTLICHDWWGAGHLKWQASTSRWSYRTQVLADTPLPDVVFRAIQCELDQLSPMETLVVKVAATVQPVVPSHETSGLPSSFTTKEVCAAFPRDVETRHADALLDALCKKCFLIRIQYETGRSDADRSFCFVSKIVQQVCSEMMHNAHKSQTRLEHVLSTMQVESRLPDILRKGLADLVFTGKTVDSNGRVELKSSSSSQKDDSSSNIPMSISELLGGEEPPASAPGAASSSDWNLAERASRIKDREEEVREDLAKIIAKKIVEPGNSRLPEWLAKQNERFRAQEAGGGGAGGEYTGQ
jgi:class 3 adenylate cyclase